VTAALALGLGVAGAGTAATQGFDARAAVAAAPPMALLGPASSADPAPEAGEAAARAALRSMVKAAAIAGTATAENAAVPAAPEAVPEAARPNGAPLAGLNLAGLVRAGDHYEAPLAGGRRAVLTLDPAVQAPLETMLDRYRPPYAAAVVLDVATGRVLGFAGVSADDPAAAPLLPLEPFGPAASVFKLVTAAALLQQDPAVARETTCFAGGLRRVTARDLDDDARRDHRCATLGDAVAHSLNVPIGKMALKRLDPAALLRAAERFGFNRPLPFDVAAPASTARMPETPLELARMAAGFEGVRLSALQGALLAATVGAGGAGRRPAIVARAEPSAPGAPDGYVFAPETLPRALDAATAHTLARMMVGTTREGTARREFAHDPSLRDSGGGVAGKTGSLRDRERGLDFSWFVGFAPADAPRVAVAVFVANRALWHIRAPYVARVALAAALH
jgi:cell division protein FtsI/penicillin-binding protein 2